MSVLDIEQNHNITELIGKLENYRVLQQILLDNKRLTLFEKYRKCLTALCAKCKCNGVTEQIDEFNALENEYKTVEQSCTEAINFYYNGINKQEINESAKNQSSIHSHTTTDQHIHNIGIENNLLNENTGDEQHYTSLRHIIDEENEQTLPESGISSENANNKSDKSVNKTQTALLSNELCSEIFKALNEVESVITVAKQFNANDNTAQNISNIYETECRNKKCVKDGKLNASRVQQIRNWFDDNSRLTLEKAKQMCIDKWQMEFDLLTISRYLKKFHYSFHFVPDCVELNNDFDTITQRYNYALIYRDMTQKREKMFFVDEIGLELCSRWPRDRSFRSQNYTFSGAVNLESLYFFEIENKFYKIGNNSTFLEKLLQRFDDNIPKIENVYLIMDSLKFNNKSEVIKMISSRGHHPVFLPPFSPFLNPIHGVFEDWKILVRSSEPQNETELYANLSNSLINISAQHCNYRLSNMEMFIDKCLNKQNITD